MDINITVLIVLSIYWLVSVRKVDLCLLIIAYYALFLIADLTELDGLFETDLYTTFGTYCVQLSIDAVVLVSIAVLSFFYHESIKLFAAYGAIVATSFLLNGFMIYEQVLELSTVYKLHAIRQDFSVPLDVLFAVLGSAHNARQNTLDSLHTAYSSIYNCLNRISNYFQGFEK